MGLADMVVSAQLWLVCPMMDEVWSVEWVRFASLKMSWQQHWLNLLFDPYPTAHTVAIGKLTLSHSMPLRKHCMVRTCRLCDTCSHVSI